MADKWPLATGNWSNAANWNGGTKPVVGDTVYADGKTLTIDENIDIGNGLCTTETRSGGTAGGSFVLNNNRTIVANFRGGTTTCISSWGTGVILTGNVQGSLVSVGRYGALNIGSNSIINGNILAGTQSDSYGVSNYTNTGVVVNGFIQGGPGGGQSAPGIATFSGQMVVNGSVLGGLYVNNDSIYQNFGINQFNAGSNLVVNGNLNSTTSTVSALRITANGSYSLTVNGNVYAGTQSQNQGIRFTVTTGTGTIVVNGLVFGKGAEGINFQGTGSLTVTGDSIAGYGGVGIGNYSVGGTVRVYGTAIGNDWGLGYTTNAGYAGVYGGGSNSGVVETITSVRSVRHGANGQAGVAGRVFLDVTDIANSFVKMRGNPSSFTEYTLATAENLGSLPSDSDVRLGTVFNFGTRTGTCAVPGAASVAVGVPVDNTVGTAAITAASISSALADEFASVLSAIGNIEVDNAAIAQAVRSELGLTGSLDSAFNEVIDTLDSINIGNGPRTVTITVNDGTTNLTGAVVTATRGGVTYYQTTISGVVTFYLTDGDWTITVGCEGYSSSGGTLTVNGTEAQTYSLSPVSISASSPGKTTGYWTCFDEDGNPEEGASVSIAVAETASTVSGNSYDSKTRTELSAANGVVQFTNMHKGVTYRIQRGTNGPTYLVTVPLTAGGSVALDSFIGLDDA